MDFSPVFVSLAKGLKESVAADAVNPDAGTLILENFDVKQQEELVPRDDSLPISNLQPIGAFVPTAWRLATRGNSLIRFSQYGTGNPLFSYSPSRDRWVPISSTINGPTAYNLTSVAGGQISAHSSAYLPGYVAVGFVNADNAGEAHIVDETTGVSIFSAIFALNNTARVRVLTCNSLFVWLADDMTNQQIDAFVVDPANPVGFSAVVSNLAIHPWQSCLDAIVVGNTIHAAYAVQASQVEESVITPTAGSLAHVTREIIDASGRGPHVVPSECMSYVRDLGGSGKVGIVVVDLVFGVRLLWDLGGTGSTALSYIMEGAQSLVHHTLNVTACTTSNAAAGDVQVIIEFHPSDIFTATVAGSLGGAGWNTGGFGVGKTLTATATGVQTVDTHALALLDVVLVTGDLSGLHSLTAKDWGLYRVTTAGAVGVAAILTRATNFDTAAEITRDCLVRVTTGGFARAQYHIGKILDDENSPTTFAPGTFTLDESALSIAFIDPTSDVHHQLITGYRRYDRYLWTAFKSAANAVTSAQWTRGLGLTGHAYAHGGHRFVWANYDNDGEAIHQGSYYLLECPATIATGPATPQTAFAVDFEAGIQINSHLQDIAINQAGNALGAAIIRSTAVATDDGQRTIQLAEIEINPSVGHIVEAGGSVFTPGGILGQFDGRTYFPALFPFAPDGLSAIPSTAVGGLGNFTAGTVNKSGTSPPDVTIAGVPPTPTVIWIEVTTGVTFAGGATSAGRFRWSTNRGGTYTTGEIIADNVPLGSTGFVASFTAGTYATDNKYRTTSETLYRVAVVFRVTDTNGRTQRSAPVFKDVILYAGQSSILVDVIPFYRLVDKPSVYVEIYRSQANVPESLNLAFFDVTQSGADFGTFTMNDTDNRIAGNQLLYTSGGVEARVPVGGIADICLHSNRLVAISMDDPTKLLVSTPLADGEVPGFTDSGAIQVPAITYAIANFLDTLVVFSEDATRIQAPSDGPNSQGQGSWPQLQPIEGGTTTTQPLSVCVTPDGLGFVSKGPTAGYQVVTRALTIESAGIDVQAQLSAAGLVDTIHVPRKSQTRIYLDNNTVVVWDHLHQQWGTYTAVPSSAATVWNGQPVYFTDFNNQTFDTCRVETPGAHVEVPTYRAESPWLQVAVLKGTPYPNIAGYERIRRAVGVGRILGGTHSLLVEVFADGNVTTPIAQYVGTMTTDWNWRIRSVGKCSRIKIRVTVLNCTGAGVAIRGITLELGGKVGLQRRGSNLSPA